MKNCNAPMYEKYKMVLVVGNGDHSYLGELTPAETGSLVAAWIVKGLEYEENGWPDNGDDEYLGRINAWNNEPGSFVGAFDDENNLVGVIEGTTENDWYEPDEYQKEHEKWAREFLAEVAAAQESSHD